MISGETRNNIISSVALILYTLASVCILSIPFSIHFLRCWQGEFVEQSRTSLVGKYFQYSWDRNVWFWVDIVRRNEEKPGASHYKGLKSKIIIKTLLKLSCTYWIVIYTGIIAHGTNSGKLWKYFIVLRIYFLSIQSSGKMSLEIN